jgi:polyferredoxin
VTSLLSLQLQSHWLSGVFFLAAVVPLIVILAGNVYCGYLCPFGALQELLGDLRPKRWSFDPDKRVWRYGRAVKYVLLLLIVLLFAITRDFAVLAADPLISLFGSARTWSVTAMMAVILILSLVYRRFWCRNLCPAGAFLALLGGLHVFKRLWPATRPTRCDLGVRTASELDCLCCDRCRHAKD